MTHARHAARRHVGGFVEGLELRLMMSGSVDIRGTKPAAADLPRINLLLRRGPDGPPLEGLDPIFGEPTYNISGYLDTGGRRESPRRRRDVQRRAREVH